MVCLFNLFLSPIVEYREDIKVINVRRKNQASCWPHEAGSDACKESFIVRCLPQDWGPQALKLINDRD